MSKNLNIKNSLKIKNFEFKIGALVVLIILVVFPQKADASAFSLGVYPPIIKIRATAPVSLKTPIIIKNQTDQTETFNISFKPFTQSDNENGQVRYLKSGELNLKDPLIFQKIKVFDKDQEISSIELGPKQQKELSLRIDITQDETLSDYYFSLLFTSSPATDAAQKNKSQIITAVATNVLLTVGQITKPQVKINEFNSSFFKDKGPIEFSVKTSNQGEQFISTSGYILIKNLFGQTVGRVDLEKTNILANTSRSITAAWPETFLLGPYTATLILTFYEHSPALTQTTRFIGAPVQILLISLIVISSLLIVKAKLKSRLRK